MQKCACIAEISTKVTDGLVLMFTGFKSGTYGTCRTTCIGGDVHATREGMTLDLDCRQLGVYQGHSGSEQLTRRATSASPYTTCSARLGLCDDDVIDDDDDQEAVGVSAERF